MGSKPGSGSRGLASGGGALTPSFPPGLQPGQARGLLPEERGERAARQAAETEAAERRHLPPRLARARRPGQGPRRQGSPQTSQRPPATLLAHATVTSPSPIGAVTWEPRESAPAPFPGIALPSPSPHPTPRQSRSIFISREFFMSYRIELEMQGGRGLCQDSASCGRRHFSPGGAAPPFQRTELPQGETGTSPLPSPEALLLGGGAPLAVTLWTVCAITSTKDLCWGGSRRGPGGPLKHFCLTLCHLLPPCWG